ncbi:MAG: hypothetical protein J6T91_01205 [Alphaproteobacteria bacterium]|nr:hypothetical protein [Alphaproteobacteria bacterium]
MKKKVFLCLAVSLLVFESIAKKQQPINAKNERQILDIRGGKHFTNAKKNLGLMDFLKSGSETQEDKSGKIYEVKATDSKSAVVHKDTSAETQTAPVDQVSVISDNIVESPSVIGQNRTKDLTSSEVSVENKIDEVFVNSFPGVTNLTDLLRNIQSNVEKLTLGRMSNADYNKLIQKKRNISIAKDQYTSSTLAYDKICAMEQILINYNSISEIFVYFLTDIHKHELNKVQEALFLSKVDSLEDVLTYTFKTPISNNLKNSIANIHEEIGGYEIKEFLNNLLKEVEKIPNELLDPEQYKIVEKILKDLHSEVTGDFKSKCATLKYLLDSYNNLKDVRFKLKKISSESVKKLALKVIEDIFFEKMLKTLRTMDEEHYSATSENDSEALAALNIKKAMCKMLGGTSYSGKEYKSNIELFRTAESLTEKQSLLKDSISQFNKAVDLFKIAIDSLKTEGRRPKLRNIDEINTINEDIDKIFEKIAIYDKNAKKENSENFQKVVIEKDVLSSAQTQNREGPNNSSNKKELDNESESTPLEDTEEISFDKSNQWTDSSVDLTGDTEADIQMPER